MTHNVWPKFYVGEKIRTSFGLKFGEIAEVLEMDALWNICGRPYIVRLDDGTTQKVYADDLYPLPTTKPQEQPTTAMEHGA